MTGCHQGCDCELGRAGPAFGLACSVTFETNSIYASDGSRTRLAATGYRGDVEAGVLSPSGDRHRTETNTYLLCAAGGGVSDVTAEIYLAQIREFGLLDQVPSAWHQVVDTTHDLEAVVTEIERKVYSAAISESAQRGLA
jgi:hypothetical protein